jgi:hypothetical protein
MSLSFKAPGRKRAGKDRGYFIRPVNPGLLMMRLIASGLGLTQRIKVSVRLSRSARLKIRALVPAPRTYWYPLSSQTSSSFVPGTSSHAPAHSSFLRASAFGFRHFRRQADSYHSARRIRLNQAKSNQLFSHQTLNSYFSACACLQAPGALYRKTTCHHSRAPRLLRPDSIPASSGFPRFAMKNCFLLFLVLAISAGIGRAALTTRRSQAPATWQTSLMRCSSGTQAGSHPSTVPGRLYRVRELAP